MDEKIFELLFDEWFNVTDKVIMFKEIDFLQLHNLFSATFDIIDDYSKEELVPKQISKLLLDMHDFMWWVLTLEETPLHEFYQGVISLVWAINSHFLSRDENVEAIKKTIEKIAEGIIDPALLENKCDCEL